jgi:hypothetical protein
VDRKRPRLPRSEGEDKKKRKGHIFPVQKEGIKREKRMEIEIN